MMSYLSHADNTINAIRAFKFTCRSAYHETIGMTPFEALQGRLDYTAPHYKYHDDPHLIPGNYVRKITYETSIEFGRKAAQYVKENLPQYFDKNDASPNVLEFNPILKIENSPKSLMMNIMNGNVTDATNVYNALKTDGRLNNYLKYAMNMLVCYKVIISQKNHSKNFGLCSMLQLSNSAPVSKIAKFQDFPDGHKSADCTWRFAICYRYLCNLRFLISRADSNSNFPYYNWTKKRSTSVANVKIFINKYNKSTEQKMYGKEALSINFSIAELPTVPIFTEQFLDFTPDSAASEILVKNRFLAILGSNSLAQQIFNAMENKTPRAYCALIKGLSKIDIAGTCPAKQWLVGRRPCFYSRYEEAYKLYKEAKEKGFKIDLEAYNALIPAIVKKDGKFWDIIVTILTEMKNEGVRPNIDTFNILLEVINENKLTKSQSLSLSVIAEMKKLGIEPSLTSYYFILKEYYPNTYAKGPPLTIIYSIIDEIEDKHFTFRHPKDAMFFPKAMDVCANHLNDVDLACRIENLMNLGRNRDLLGPPVNLSIYYRLFFKVLCTDEVEQLIEYYDKLVPNTFVPDKYGYKEILEVLDVNMAYHYIGKIWTDIVTAVHERNEVVIETMLSIIAKPMDNEQLVVQFSEIAKHIQEKVLLNDRRRNKKAIQLSGTMFNNLIHIHLNSARLEEAWHVFKNFQKLEHKVTGFISAACIKRFIEECNAKEDREKARILIRYGLEEHPDEAEYLSLKATDHFEIDSAERQALESLMKKPPPSTKSSHD
ncbi:Protein PTCD3, mitochondrial [Nymphon striatum]|nr:Protein PTCD3, mitochondrial [Nymphon striatum]